MSNIIQTPPSIKIKQTIVGNLSLQNSCPAPPCTPLGTPPDHQSTPLQSPQSSLQRIHRSNSACIGNTELNLPCKYGNTKLNSKRRNTQLLNTQIDKEQHGSDSEQVHLQHRLQSLRILAAGSQKTKVLLNKGLSKDLKDSIDEEENEELKEEKNNIEKKELKDQSKLNSRVNSALEEIKENDYRVRSIKSNQELDELIKENNKGPNDISAIQNDVQKIMENAKLRKKELMDLLQEHDEIVKKIKLAETTK